MSDGVKEGSAASAGSVSDRIAAYLVSGGLFNPEQAIHDRVRDLLIDCRDEIERLRLTDAEREADVARLRVAATALYRHRWVCDELQPGEQAALWESLRDAIGLPPGTATSMGVEGQ